MRVLATVDTVGGVWSYALELARALAPEGVAFHLAAMGAPASEAQRAEAAAAGNVTLHESAYRLEWMPDPWDDVKEAGGWLLELEATLAPDLVHLNGYAHGALPWASPLLVVGHSDVLSWWRAVHREPPPPEWTRYRDAVRRGLHSADLVVAPSAAMLDALRRHYGPLPPSRVIYNGRSPAQATPAEKRPVVLAAGRLWDEAKNLAALAAIAPELPWPVLVAGDEAPPDRRAAEWESGRVADRATIAGADGAGPGRPRGGRAAGDAAAPESHAGRVPCAAPGSSSGPATRTGEQRPAPSSTPPLPHSPIQHLGRLPQDALASEMQTASTFAAPALYEPFGLAALEAGLAGCALVLGDIPSYREIWGDAALRVDPRRPDALRDALLRLIEDEALRREMGERARRRALGFSRDRLGRGYAAAYARLLSLPGRGRRRASWTGAPPPPADESGVAV